MDAYGATIEIYFAMLDAISLHHCDVCFPASRCTNFFVINLSRRMAGRGPHDACFPYDIGLEAPLISDRLAAFVMARVVCCVFTLTLQQCYHNMRPDGIEKKILEVKMIGSMYMSICEE